MPFLPPNQQRQSTEGEKSIISTIWKTNIQTSYCLYTQNKHIVSHHKLEFIINTHNLWLTCACMPLPHMNCTQHVHVGSKTLYQQNPPVLNQRCWLTQADLYNSHRMVVCCCCNLCTTVHVFRASAILLWIETNFSNREWCFMSLLY